MTCFSSIWYGVNCRKMAPSIQLLKQICLLLYCYLFNLLTLYMPVVRQISRFTGTGWPSHTVCRCPDGTMRYTTHLVMEWDQVWVNPMRASCLYTTWCLQRFILGLSLCRTHQSGLWTILHSLLGLSMVCLTWPSTLTETCCWWRTWTMLVHPRSSSKGSPWF